MSSPADKAALNELHALIAKAMADRIRGGDFTAADLSVARQFLKDNNIEAIPTPGSPLEGLHKSVADNLPFPAQGLPN